MAMAAVPVEAATWWRRRRARARPRYLGFTDGSGRRGGWFSARDRDRGVSVPTKVGRLPAGARVVSASYGEKHTVVLLDIGVAYTFGYGMGGGGSFLRNGPSVPDAMVPRVWFDAADSTDVADATDLAVSSGLFSRVRTHRDVRPVPVSG